MDAYWSPTMKRVLPDLRRGDLAAVERGIAEQLRTLPRSPFHLVLDLNITNEPGDAARHFDRFFERAARRFAIAAAYTEMNGFEINPDRWYCDLFAYDKDGGHDDYDWLSDWQSERFGEYEINGLEELQAVYDSDAFGNDAYCDAEEECGLLVVAKFQRFVSEAAGMMRKLQFPLYVTAHGREFIAELRPSA